MKKIVIALCLGFAFTSCSESDDNDNVLVGKWFPQGVIINGTNTAYEGNVACGNDYLYLKDFNTFEIVDFYNNDEEPCSSQKFYGSYTVLNNELKLIGSDFFQGGEIIEKSSTQLKLKRMIDVNGDGTNDEVIEVFSK